MKITNVKFINKETGEILFVLEQAEIEGYPFSYWGHRQIDSNSCAEAGDDLKQGQG